MRFVLSFCVLLSLSGIAGAQYPSKPIKLIVPAAPGGGTDITARSFVPALQDGLGQSVVIENRGGAGGVIGTEVAAKSSPDGYTLLLCYVSHATNPTLVGKLPYDTLKDFVPITLVGHEPVVLVTHPSNPANSLAEFTSWAKAQGGKLSYATDPGSSGFLGAELYKQLSGVKAEYIAYKGSGPAAADVVGGHVPYMWSVISIVTPYAKSGRLKALSIAAEKRSPSLPEVPTTAEGGMPNFVVSGWYGLLAPAGTPKPIVDRIHAEMVKALKNEGVISRMATAGSQPIGGGPEALDAHIRSEIARWDRVLKTAGIQLAR